LEPKNKKEVINSTTLQPNRGQLRRSRSLNQLRNDNSEQNTRAPFRKHCFARDNTTRIPPAEKPEPNRLAFSYEISRDEIAPPRPAHAPPSQDPKTNNKCKS